MTILPLSRHYSEAEVGFQPTRTSKPFTGLRHNTVVWKAYADFGWKAPHSRPESNETTILDNPPRIPPLFSHYPVTIWRRRSESPRVRLHGRKIPLILRLSQSLSATIRQYRPP